ncbi:MAG: AAA family ATPase [Nanoarchaeota archaeon]|nr:AAA family ATPase [Nanoarchaeota archaeon]MBU1854738.1 AAA family ATPase [Nanoarchaeota archaeon]
MIIGITGTLGAGKGTIGEYLVKKKGFNHFSVRAAVNKEIIKRGLPLGRDSLVTVANDMRKKHGSSYWVELLYKEAKKSKKNCVIESIRTEGEINNLKKKGKFILFGIDANPKIRYERIKKRKSESDDVSYQKFLEDEKREFTAKDSNAQNLSRCIELADFKFENNNLRRELYKKIEKTLKTIGE